MNDDPFYARLFPTGPFHELPIPNGPYGFRRLRPDAPLICTRILDFHQQAWRRSMQTRPGLLRRLALPWAVAAWLRASLREFRTYGAAARREYGRSTAGQWQDLWRVYCQAAITPAEYYNGHLARHEGGPALGQYLGFGVLARVLLELQRQALGMPDFLLTDKLDFSDWCSANGVACPPQFALQPGEDWRATQLAVLGTRLVVKPRSAFGGAGIQLWEQVGKHSWREGGRIYSTDQFKTRLDELAAQWPPGIVIQTCLENDRRLPYRGQALATCRIVTMLNEEHRPEIVEAYQRIAHDPAAVVDNFTAGGTFWLVDDFNRGTIAYGGSKASKTTQSLLREDAHHGELCAGKLLPGWRTIAEFALSAHARAARSLAIGWDIALTGDGPVMIEANFPPSLTTLWQYNCEGFSRSRAARLFGHWLDRL